MKYSKPDNSGNTENCNKQIPEIHSATRSQVTAGQAPLSREKKDMLMIYILIELAEISVARGPTIYHHKLDPIRKRKKETITAVKPMSRENLDLDILLLLFCKE